MQQNVKVFWQCIQCSGLCLVFDCDMEAWPFRHIEKVPTFKRFVIYRRSDTMIPSHTLKLWTPLTLSDMNLAKKNGGFICSTGMCQSVLKPDFEALHCDCYVLRQWSSILVLEGHCSAYFSCFPALQEVFTFCKSLLGFLCSSFIRIMHTWSNKSKQVCFFISLDYNLQRLHRLDSVWSFVTSFYSYKLYLVNFECLNCCEVITHHK